MSPIKFINVQNSTRKFPTPTKNFIKKILWGFEGLGFATYESNQLSIFAHTE